MKKKLPITVLFDNTNIDNSRTINEDTNFVSESEKSKPLNIKNFAVVKRCEMQLEQKHNLSLAVAVTGQLDGLPSRT
jgi:hypothetical protein